MLARAILAALCLSTPALAESAGPQGVEGGAMREQEWRVPSANSLILMDSTVFRPADSGRHPLAVINHGSPANAGDRPTMKRQRYAALSSFFVERGYVVVLPLRRGYGATGGGWAEQYGSCTDPHYMQAGLETAADIQAAIDYMRRQPFVLPDHTIVAGHSAGGWGTLALSSLNPAGVPGMIDFAGGRGGHQRAGNCEPQTMVKAAAVYGSTGRVPLLWINAANDSFFDPRLVDGMVAAYNGAGGHAVHRQVEAFGKDGHVLASNDNGAPIWRPLVEDFLKSLH